LTTPTVNVELVANDLYRVVSFEIATVNVALDESDLLSVFCLEVETENAASADRVLKKV
jgi:hypothetical protein